MALELGSALLGSAGISAGSALLGSFIDSFDKSAEKQDAINYQRQKEFAQNQLQWRAADAEKAGLSKFAALSGSNSFYTPSYSGSSSNFGSGVAAAGGAFSDAMQKYAVLSQQEALTGQKLDNRNKVLDNKLKEQDIQAKEIKQGNSLTRNTGGLDKTLSKDNQEFLEDSPFGAPFKIDAVVETLTKNPAGAKRELANMSPIFKKSLFDVHEDRKATGVLRSVPTFDLSTLNYGERQTLKDYLYQLGYLDNAINKGALRSKAEIDYIFKNSDSDALNNALDPAVVDYNQGSLLYKNFKNFFSRLGYD
ncbi:DNA pilot protein [Peromfec virus RodF8_37]|uniref:DNA pilot protein n=1 Tax=Peromfec virus RodF8_37 TaxID=2929372 RepID=A0A976R889_9VIRU|nr:DNA pilot protein [Peromfec virus RodF8_37]